MDEKRLDSCVLRLLEAWVLLRGFWPAEGWDADDISCRFEEGRHVIWTVTAYSMLSVIDYDCLWQSLQAYLAALHSEIYIEPHALSIKPRGQCVHISVSVCQ